MKFDHLDKAFCILKLDPFGLMDDDKEEGEEEERWEGGGADKDQAVEKRAEARSQKQPPLIKRVDFIVAPAQQYPYALVSWTGSKVTLFPDLL